MVLEINLKEEKTLLNTVDRWQMSRAGVLNFWYYDEEEFHFEEGRMILRGTNGSGKSVTMQSFIPLVLDGDKRPERLDPFGSRDRKLEYYLLGDEEKGHTDRTGYLWLEFYHPHKKIYKTIGIGIRARRGAAQLGFWGFLLEDGRRVNQDFWLYDYKLWLEQGNKVPLNRKELTDQIDSGGQVVQEQSSYREMVNKALFGFQDPDSFKDLLKLLLELRSPKLSKDFKPSSMYEILTKALPPLKEEELGPLSDVIEDMDQITDQLEELRIHVDELGKVNEKYNEYNRFLLNLHSEEVLTNSEVCAQLEKQVAELRGQVLALKNEQFNIIASMEQDKTKLGTVEVELDILNRSEVIEKQRELERAEEQLKETLGQLGDIRKRKNKNVSALNQVEQEIEQAEGKLNLIVQEQHETVEELEDLARTIEFGEHDIYHRAWTRGIPEDQQWAHNWLKDLERHKENLVVALKIAREEREAFRAASEAEIRLGEIHRERSIAEDEQAAQDSRLEIEKEKIRENLVRWQQGLHQLPVDGEGLRDSLRALSLLTAKDRQYDRVRQAAVQAYEHRNQELLEQGLQLQHHKKVLLDDCHNLELEQEQWRSTKEPEPKRTEKRKATRGQRKKGIGAPLFAVCEFNDVLTEDEQARLEETLEQVGLLDAWIFPGGKVSVLDQEEGEEVWIEPTNSLHEMTLANMLQATPSQESGLSDKDIQAALKSIGWAREGENTQIDKESLVIGDGTFRLGALTGQGFSKLRAEYIGKETRLRTKQLAMAQLEADLQQLVNKISDIDEQLTMLEENNRALKAELESFPDDKELQVQIDIFIQFSYRLTEIMNQEQKVELWYKEKMALLRGLQLKLAEQTANWSLLKGEKQISEALDLCMNYRSRISALKSSWLRYSEISQYQSKQVDQQANLLLEIEEDEFQLKIIEEKKEKYTAQVGQLKNLMVEMGLQKVHEQIVTLKQEKITLLNRIDTLHEKKEKLIAGLSGKETTFNIFLEQLNDCQTQFYHTVELWKGEVQLALVPKWKEALDQLTDENEIPKICRQIKKEYGSQFGTRTKERIGNELQLEYNAVRNNLRDYVVEMDFLSSGRMVITSKRDRMNPMTPSMLLDELIKQRDEQRTLLTEKDRQLYEEIIIGSVGKAIRHRIHRARDWVDRMKALMSQRDTSSGLQLSLVWEAKAPTTESELDTESLVELLLRDAHRMEDEEIELIIEHFRKRILQAKQYSEEEQGALRRYIYNLLDYRSWFEFKLHYRKGDQTGYRELTDAKFNVLSGGEKAMAMYIPLFAATYSRYSDASADAPKIISLDEAFAGVDDANMRDMFHLLTDMGFDYMMTSQVLWGCYDTVPRLAIYEIYRPKDINVVTLFHYRWNGKSKVLIEN
ncbi:TIGR02680 family protein [Paenibacillus apiarius]|uniref:TIGR02680 family protein n=1 Tax=Paenibacillus apiarius TaxID=46240 RepID=A0ABT4DY55_9BACL|nr:TIGR02680 family protein [Paenibacillus apiarius]MCY9517443.1 TIGR02680 family protein [Paenibacillus apiarius]MCY9522278.1 TIGR02680 family protein [Paenibacillus apiarius]MCY9552312.1 TIGR02680 family protein [Paenibacillus apiarius]MCY9560191.1 TIGR02680 family protein [Paenibacillus apiarius]MCY9683809.1 TIGR02680 family protein [Paenibacillus apiarius]